MEVRTKYGTVGSREARGALAELQVIFRQDLGEHLCALGGTDRDDNTEKGDQDLRARGAGEALTPHSLHAQASHPGASVRRSQRLLKGRLLGCLSPCVIELGGPGNLHF